LVALNSASPRSVLSEFYGHLPHLLTRLSYPPRTTYVFFRVRPSLPNSSPQDCFYASVFEHENPALRRLPLAVQQKQIVVTCNYEARRRGLHKLQLIHEARKVCPDVVVVLGEDLTRFRNASKELYAFLRSFSWNSRCERLGFDEVCRPRVSTPPLSCICSSHFPCRISLTLSIRRVMLSCVQVFLDVTDIIDYNVSILNYNDLTRAFFCLAKDDPTVGFSYDATRLTGHLYPKTATENLGKLHTAVRRIRCGLVCDCNSKADGPC
jgi:DNA polymerase iota